MTWDEDLFALFDDLESQAEALFDTERGLELADRSRAEYAAVPLASRLMASLDRDLDLQVAGPGAVRGRLARVSREWVLVAGHGQEWVVVVDAIATARGLSSRSVPEVAWPVSARLGVASALRRLADAGERCVVHLRNGDAHDVVLGRIGADFVEGTPARRGAGALVLGRAQIAAVQSRPLEIAL